MKFSYGNIITGAAMKNFRVVDNKRSKALMLCCILPLVSFFIFLK